MDASDPRAQPAAAVLFASRRCPHCVEFKPVFERVAASLRERVGFWTLDVDDDEETPSQFAVSVLPTVVFLRNGVPVGRVSGALDAERFKAEVERRLS